MIEQTELRATLVELSGLSLRAFDAEELLQTLRRRIVTVLGAADASVSLVGADGVLHPIDGTTPAAGRFGALEAELRQGAGRNAFESQRVVVAAASRPLTSQWPDLVPLLRQAGVQAVAAVPLSADGTRLGTLDLFWTDGPGVDDDRLATAATLATITAGYIVAGRRAEVHAATQVAELARVAEQALRSDERAVRAVQQAKTELLSRTSHVLRTPLNAILGFSQLLQLSPRTPDDEEAIEQIVRSGTEMLQLVDELIDISNLESGAIDLRTKRVVLAEVVKSAVDLLRPRARTRDISIEIDPGNTTTLRLVIDPHCLQEILVILLSNAVEYNRHGGMIVVGARHVPPSLLITVADTGTGLAPTDLAKLFVPFQRLGAEHRGIEGTGLGLARALAMAKGLGGELTATSVVGRGSTFTLEVPAEGSRSLRLRTGVGGRRYPG